MKAAEGQPAEVALRLRPAVAKYCRPLPTSRNRRQTPHISHSRLAMLAMPPASRASGPEAARDRCREQPTDGRSKEQARPNGPSRLGEDGAQGQAALRGQPASDAQYAREQPKPISGTASTTTAPRTRSSSHPETRRGRLGWSGRASRRTACHSAATSSISAKQDDGEQGRCATADSVGKTSTLCAKKPTVPGIPHSASAARTDGRAPPEQPRAGLAGSQERAAEAEGDERPDQRAPGPAQTAV